MQGKELFYYCNWTNFCTATVSTRNKLSLLSLTRCDTPPGTTYSVSLTAICSNYHKFAFPDQGRGFFSCQLASLVKLLTNTLECGADISKTPWNSIAWRFCPTMQHVCMEIICYCTRAIIQILNSIPFQTFPARLLLFSLPLVSPARSTSWTLISRASRGRTYLDQTLWTVPRVTATFPCF